MTIYRDEGLSQSVAFNDFSTPVEEGRKTTRDIREDHWTELKVKFANNNKVRTGFLGRMWDFRMFRQEKKSRIVRQLLTAKNNSMIIFGFGRSYCLNVRLIKRRYLSCILHFAENKHTVAFLVLGSVILLVRLSLKYLQFSLAINRDINLQDYFSPSPSFFFFFLLLLLGLIH